MIWLQRIGAAFLLVVLTLCLQCAGVAALISWLRTVRSDVSLVQISSAVLIAFGKKKAESL